MIESSLEQSPDQLLYQLDSDTKKLGKELGKKTYNKKQSSVVFV